MITPDIVVVGVVVIGLSIASSCTRGGPGDRAGPGRDGAGGVGRGAGLISPGTERATDDPVGQAEVAERTAASPLVGRVAGGDGDRQWVSSHRGCERGLDRGRGAGPAPAYGRWREEGIAFGIARFPRRAGPQSGAAWRTSWPTAPDPEPEHLKAWRTRRADAEFACSNLVRLPALFTRRRLLQANSAVARRVRQHFRCLGFRIWARSAREVRHAQPGIEGRLKSPARTPGASRSKAIPSSRPAA